MKKVLFVLMMALMSLGAQAQEFGYSGYVDESDLTGKWSACKYEGDLSAFHCSDRYFDITSITFKEDGTIWSTGFDIGWPLDWFISNNNKIHFIITNHVFKFIIWEYVKNEKLVLATFDKKNFLYLQKDEPASVRSMTKEEIPDSNKYNLQGMKVEDPEGIYIQNGQKFIAK